MTPQPQSSSAVKTVLVVVAAIVVLGIIAVATVAFIGLRIARHTKIENDNGNVRIQSPLGNMQTTTDPEKVAQSLGVDLYPGARVLTGNSADITVAGIHTTAAELETDDSSDKVAAFYKSKFPNPTVSSSGGGSTTIVSRDHHNVVTITIEAEGSKTKVHIANVSGKDVS
jgi:hypothetical protein